ncbi:hypothetical protein [Pedobacter sp. R-06]|uniref:hypothetical protein n=1 Tax=Pedobacter sp. R-06 TaxID=3404051 RepID=UPI003CF918EB
MNSLLFGGAQSVGKTETIFRLTNYLLSKGFVDVLSTVPAVPIPPAKVPDYKAILKGTNKLGQAIKIIINSATDTPGLIWDFKNVYDTNGSHFDILISSVRDGHHWPRAEFFSIMGLNPASPNNIEIPLARITRRAHFDKALNWYEEKLDLLAQHTLSNAPFNI